MKRKTVRFLINFSNKDKDEFLKLSEIAVLGTKDNNDFKNAPVLWADFKAAYDLMLNASPNAVRGNQAALAIFRPLRETVEGQLRKLAMFAQPLIGDNYERAIASGLPRAADPKPRPNMLTEVEKPVANLGPVSGSISVRASTSKAADGLEVDIEQVGGSFKETYRFNGFSKTFEGFEVGKLYEIRLRYWNDMGRGPAMSDSIVLKIK